MKRSRPSFLVLAFWCATAGVVAGCADAQEAAEGDFEPARAGTLTVATSLPAAGFWNSERVETLDGGFEWGLAEAFADEFDLELEVVDIPLADIVAGDLHGADVALAQVSVTSEREEEVAFSDPYFSTQPTVVVRTGEDDLDDLLTARESSWAVRRSTTEAAFVDDVIRPDDDPMLTDTESDAIERVRSGDVDAALTDLATAFELTQGDDAVEVIARFDDTEDIAAVFPQSSETASSDNIEALNQAIARFVSDDTLDDLDERWLEPAFGSDPDALTVIQTDATKADGTKPD